MKVVGHAVFSGSVVVVAVVVVSAESDEVPLRRGMMRGGRRRRACRRDSTAIAMAIVKRARNRARVSGKFYSVC